MTLLTDITISADYDPTILGKVSGRNVTAKHADGSTFGIKLSIFEIMDEGEKRYAGRCSIINQDGDSVNDGETKFTCNSLGIIDFVDDAFQLLIGTTQLNIMA